MTFRFGVTVAGAILLSGVGTSDWAAAGTQSFRDSCNNISITKVNGRTVVHAYCDAGKTADGLEGLTENKTDLVIPPEGCADISNDRGQLRCVGAEFPGGSWSQTCIEGRYIRGRVFQAVCAPNGTREPSVYSSVDMNGCSSFALKNINGHLQCTSKASAPPIVQAPSVADGPVKAIGKVKGAAPSPSLPICEAARQARARNSPAAPGLEAHAARHLSVGQDTWPSKKSGCLGSEERRRSGSRSHYRQHKRTEQPEGGAQRHLYSRDRRTSAAPAQP